MNEVEKTTIRGKWTAAKKLLLVLLLLCLGGKVISSRELFYATQTYDPGSEGKATISLLEHSEITQEFVAQTEDLVNVGINFKASDSKNASGGIFVDIRDTEGNTLASAKKNVKNLVQNKSSNKTTFSIPVKLEAGKPYVLAVRGENLMSEEGIYLYYIKNTGGLFGLLSLDGVGRAGKIRMSFTMGYYSQNSLRMMLVFLGAAILFVLLPIGRRDVLPKGRLCPALDLNKLFSRILFFAAPFLAFYIVQRFADFHIREFLSMLPTRLGFLNLLLYGLIWGLLYLVTNRTRLTAVLTVGLAFVLGLANYFVWVFRGTPVMAADIASIGTAMNVAGGYSYELNLSSLWAAVYAASFIAAALSLKSYKGLRLRGRLCVLILYLIPFSFFHTKLLNGTYLKDHKISVNVFSPNKNYSKNGSLLSFFMSYTYYRVETPARYSLKNVAAITEKYPSDSVSDGESTRRPNVIAIMNEALADLDADGDLETSADFMPFLHSLTDNTVKGTLFMSVFGGNTANSEFEFLTGDSMAFFPYRAIPFNTYIRNSLPSLTSTLKDQGYVGNYAVHPYKRSGWNREEVYKHMGFDEFFSIEAFESAHYIRGFVSDQSDYDFIISKYEECRQTHTEPFYTFTVTIQNHGGYGETMGLIDTPITITNQDQYSQDAQQYINLVKASDDAFQSLVSYFQQVEEPTVIVMFGDHQPSLSSGFYTSLFQKSQSDLTLAEILKKHSVPYVIWANYDIAEQEVNMSANYLSAYLLDLIGSPLTGYQKYLLDLRKELPIVTANGYQGADGVLRTPDEASEYSDLLEEYELIQYNHIFDSSHRMEEFFRLAD